MNQLRNSLNFIALRSLLLLATLWVAAPAFARNYVFQGEEIIIEQPEGTLKYYDLFINGETESSWCVPFVFADDGRVFAKNLFSFAGGFGRFPTWMEGYMDNGSIVFNDGAAAAFDLSDFPEPPVVYFNITCDGSAVEPDEGLRFEFSSDGEGNYIFDEKGELFYYSWRLGKITRVECRPSSHEFVVPPAGYKEEDYQIDFIPYNAFYRSCPEAALRLKAIRTEKAIYLKGFSILGAPDGWIKGDIVGDKVIFPPSVTFGVGGDGKPLYFTPMAKSNKNGEIQKGKHRVDGIGHEIRCVPTDSPLIFDYDDSTGILSNPTSGFGVTHKPEEIFYTWYGSEVTNMDFRPNEYFHDPRIFPIPEGHKFSPQSPDYRYTKDWIYLSYRDKDGYMMEPERIFLKLFNESKSLTFRYLDFATWELVDDEKYPFENLYLNEVYGLGGVGIDLVDNLRMSSLPPKTDWTQAVLVYEGEDYIAYSDKIKEEDSAEVGSIADCENAEMTIYDLQGRRIMTDCLQPGIYIQNNRKVIVR